jgi:ATP/maltotriose-dependent transcriptional regulator MalT
VIGDEFDVARRRRLAVDLFNHVWTLLRRDARTVEQDDEMIHAAHASRYHWGEVGEATQRAIGEWQIARVYSVLGRGEPAVHHARRCLQLAEEHRLEAWLLASAYEGLARAHAVAGDRAAAAEWKARAEATAAGIDEAEERQVVEGDIATLPV